MTGQTPIRRVVQCFPAIAGVSESPQTGQSGTLEVTNKAAEALRHFTLWTGGWSGHIHQCTRQLQQLHVRSPWTHQREAEGKSIQ